MNTENTSPDDSKKAYDYAMRLVSMRNYSFQKLTEKIISKGFSEETANEAISRLKQEGFYKEDFFINANIRKMINKGIAPDQISRFLNREGIQMEREDIKQFFEENNNQIYSQDSQIESLLQKKSKELKLLNSTNREDKFKAEQKILRYLVSKGHQFDECKRVLKNYVQAQLNLEDSY